MLHAAFGRALRPALLLSLLAFATPAWGVSFTLDVEFDDGLVGDYADVEVVEDGNGLLFEVTLLSALGANADLHRLYFNLDGVVPDLQIESDDVVTTAYVLSVAPPVAGGAGSDFDYGVSFGNGAGGPGNGVLQTASFRIAPEDDAQSLALQAFLDAAPALASGGTIESMLAIHVQGTDLVQGAGSETVGGSVPEPTTGALLTAGLLLAARSRRRRS
jgi:hypothetical protein